MAFNKIKRYFSDPKYRFYVHNNLGFYKLMSDESFIKKEFKLEFGYELDLKNPKTLNEKIQWLKVNCVNYNYTKMVDKYEAKEVFKTIIGDKYVIPTIGVYNSLKEVPYDKLPKQFVIKTTHDSGGVVVCHDKDTFDFKAAKIKLSKSLRRNFYYQCREYPYKLIKPRIIVEEYLSGLDSDSIVEYKIYCFNGRPSIFLICQGQAHGAGRTNDYYDLDFNFIPVSGTFPNSDKKIEKPFCYDELLDIAKKLSKGTILLRVDTYVVGNNVYIGETTFFSDGGLIHFEPKSYDLTFGNMLVLPKE